MMRVFKHFALSVYLIFKNIFKYVAFWKPSLPPTSGETTKPGQFGPLEITNLIPQWSEVTRLHGFTSSRKQS
jgi:hypothetical protein